MLVLFTPLHGRIDDQDEYQRAQAPCRPTKNEQIGKETQPVAAAERELPLATLVKQPAAADRAGGITEPGDRVEHRVPSWDVRGQVQ